MGTFAYFIFSYPVVWCRKDVLHLCAAITNINKVFPYQLYLLLSSRCIVVEPMFKLQGTNICFIYSMRGIHGLRLNQVVVRYADNPFDLRLRPNNFYQIPSPPTSVMVTYLIIIYSLAVLALVYCGAQEGTLLDDSEYQKFLQFEEMVSNVVTEINNASSSDRNSATLNYVNLAMMYHQRNQRWKQGGIAESLHYIELALQSQESENDPAHDDHKLHRSMLLHKANMLTNLGQRDTALSVLNGLLARRSIKHTTSSAESSIFSSLTDAWNSEQIEPISQQELSNILYHKAELLLTLFDDYPAAVLLFQEAVSVYPCNYRAYFQLAHAMKATKNVTREEWTAVIAEMESYLLYIRQRTLNIKMKYKYRPPPIEFHAPYALSIPSVPINSDGLSATTAHIKNWLYSAYYMIRSTIYPTTHVCAFSRTDSTDTGLYGASTSTGYSQSDTTLSGIYASLNWALFVATDALPSTGDPEEDTQNRNVAWKYLQQARHFDRQSINEQHLYMDYQQRTEKDEDVGDVNKDMLPEGVDMDQLHQGINNDGYIPAVLSQNDVSESGAAITTLGEAAVQKMTEHSAAQVKHLVSFFKKGYWGKTEHYENYTTSVSSSIDDCIQHTTVDYGRNTRIPVFIVGFFRSGSTLLESLLEAHSSFVRLSQFNSDSNGVGTCDAGSTNFNTTEGKLAAELGYKLHSVWGMGENSPFVFEMYAMQEETLAAFDLLEKQRTALEKKYTKKKTNHKREQEENKLEEIFMKSYHGIIDKRGTSIVGKIQKSFVDMHGNLIAGANHSNAGNSTFGNNQPLMPTHIVDKMLTNYVNIGLIHQVFPKAIILHTIRDPMDTLYSCYSTRFGDPAAVYTLHTDTLVQKYVQYLEVMQHFRKVLPYYTLPDWGIQNHNADTSDPQSRTAKDSKITKGKRIQALVDVRYEELVANPERVIRYILNDILGIAYVPILSKNGSADVSPEPNILEKDSSVDAHTTADSSTVSTSTHARVVQTASRLQVKQPVYDSSVGRWLKHKAQLQQALIPAWKGHLPYLVSIGALPYADPDSLLVSKRSQKIKDKCAMVSMQVGQKRECVFMNWNSSEQFSYSEMLAGLH